MADQHDLEIVQGTTWNLSFALQQSDGTPFDLTNFVIRLTARKTYRGRLLVEATTTNGMIAVDIPTGTFRLSVPASVTQTFPTGISLYDMQIETGTGADRWVGRLLYGQIDVLPDVVTEEAA